MSFFKDFEYTTSAYQDVDHFCEISINQGWDVSVTQLSYGKNFIGYDNLILPGLILCHFRIRQATYHSFTVPDGFVLFFLSRVRQPLTWNGLRVQPSIIPIVLPGRSHNAVLPGNLDCYEILMSEEMVRRTEILPPDFFAATARLQHPYLPLVDPQTSSFTRGLDDLFCETGNGGAAGACPLDGTAIYEFTTEGLQKVVDAGLGVVSSNSPRSSRYAALVSRAQEFIAENVSTKLTSDEIAQSIGVSRRVLRYAFQENLGLSPYRYHLTERLHAVRQKLKSDHFSILESGIAHGFSTPSRLARQYKRLFGELPSETRLRKP